MNIILFDPKLGHSKTIRLRPWLIVTALTFVVSVCLFSGGLAGYHFQGLVGPDKNDPAAFIRADVERNAEQVALARQDAQEQLTAMTVRVAELQARVMRLDALGERLVDVAKLGGGEFDFSQSPSVGGPTNDDMGVAYQRPTFINNLDQLAKDIDNREQQLGILESLLSKRDIQTDVYLAGRPVKWGWLSSRFGRRTDPFNGKLAWHAGVDFAGKDGSDIITVGSGVVTWAGDRYGYGLLVEVNHGGGYTTRYAHAKKVLVKVGDIVEKGQTVALLGSTGRSTGPHVHFEVRKNGKAVDPARYVYRKAK